MSIQDNVLSPFAAVAGKLISVNGWLFEQYRRRNFKGKQYLSRFINRSFSDGVYSCQEASFDLSFEDGIQREIYLGLYERRELALLRKYVQPGWTCVDVGANVGFYAVHLAKMVGGGVVLAFEPAPENFPKLTRNVELNRLTNCTCFQQALSSRSGTLEFGTSPQMNSGWGRVGGFEGQGKTIHVQAVTLDEVLDEHAIEQVDFLKVDIEGHETQFLQGAEGALRGGRVRRMMIEYSGFALESQGIELADYLTLLRGYGFVPVELNLDRVGAALNGNYRACRETINLLVERR